MNDDNNGISDRLLMLEASTDYFISSSLELKLIGNGSNQLIFESIATLPSPFDRLLNFLTKSATYCSLVHMALSFHGKNSKTVGALENKNLKIVKSNIKYPV